MSTFDLASGGPAVSILMPVFNGESFLDGAFDHVFAQTFKDFEIVAVDDGSKDRSYELLQAYARRDPRVRVSRNAKRKGLVGNWNECLRKARGHWIKFVFQDDVIGPTCVEKLVVAARAHPGPCGIVFAKRRFVIVGGLPAQIDWYTRKTSYWDHFPVKGFLTPNDVLNVFVRYPGSNLFGEPTSFLIERRIFEEIGGFDSQLIQLCDVEFWLRAGLRYGLGFVDEELIDFRVHEKSMTAWNYSEKEYVARYLDRVLLHRKILRDDVFEVARVLVEGWPCNRFFEVQFGISARRARRALAEMGEVRALEAWKDVCRQFSDIEAASRRIYYSLGLEYVVSRACVLKRVKRNS